MPRIIAPQEPTGPGSVITLPRPREVGPTPTGLTELGTAIGNAGQLFLAEAVRQERSAETTRIGTEADTRWGALRNEVEAAGTTAEARRLWGERAPKVKEELVRFAQERGLPELLPGLDAVAKANDIEVQNFIGKRASGEGVDAAKSYAATKLEAIVNAPTEIEAQRHKLDLHRELQRVAQSNPLLSPADADLLFQTTVSEGARRRLNTLVSNAVAAGDISSLRNLQAGLEEGAFPDLPADLRASATAAVVKSIEQVEAQQQADARKAGAIAASDLFIGIFDATNPAQLEDIRQETDRLFEAGAIGPDTRVSLHRNAVSKLNGLVEDFNELAGIATQYNAGFGLNSEKDATKLYEALVVNVPPEQRPAFLAEFTINAGVPPEQGTDLLKRAEQMDRPDQLAMAADYMGTLQDRAPAAASRINVGPRVESTVALAETLGIPTQDAAQLIIDQTPDAAVIKERAEQFDATFEDFDPLTFLQQNDIFPEFWFSADPDVSDRILLETEETLRIQWQMSGNKEAAIQAAGNALKRRYSVTQVGGSFRITETPPEPFGQMMFKGNIEADVVARAVDSDIEQMLDEAGIVLPKPPAGLEDQPPWRLRADEQTRVDRGAGRPISWELWVRGDELGNMRRIPDGQGGYVRYVMPTFEQLKALGPVREVIGESMEGAHDRRIAGAMQEVRSLESELLFKRQAGQPVGDLEQRLSEARARLADTLADR